MGSWAPSIPAFRDGVAGIPQTVRSWWQRGPGASRRVPAPSAQGSAPTEAGTSEPLDHQPRLLRVVRVLRWALPVAMFVMAGGYELVEHFADIEMPPSTKTITFFSEILLFGVIGPVAASVLLFLMNRLLVEQVAGRAELQALNSRLEANVAARTADLAAARSALEEQNTVLAQANADLRQLDRLKSEFVALVSHELRRPLTNLNGGLELILDDTASLSPSTRRTCQILAEETRRLTTLVETILDVTRLDTGQLRLNLGLVALPPLVSRTAQQVFADQPQRSWSLDAQRGLPLAWADEVCIERVVHNVLANTARYTAQESPLQIALATEGGMVTVAVTDHGPGIPVEHQQHIFDAFARGPNAEPAAPSGYGLGLYLARRLVEAHAGRIWLESPVHPDGMAPGTRITFQLPIADEVPDDR